MLKYFLLGLTLLVIGILVVTRAIPKSKPTCPDCNVILITVDCITNSHLGLFGYKRDTSPNLDAWTKDAFVFNQYITTSDLTPITQTSIHTGLYPSNSGVVSFSSQLPSKVPILAELMKNAGYTTTAIGSAEEYFADGTTGWQARRASFERGYDQFFNDYFENKISPRPSTTSVSSWQDYKWPQKARGVPLSAIDWLANAPKQKFFLWIPVGTVHWPYNDDKPLHFADSNYQGILKDDHMNWKLPSQFRRIYQDKFWPKDGNPITLSKEDKQFIVDRYDDGIYITDQFLGQLFKTIKEKGLDKNTVVIFTTEHGEEFGTHGFFAHYDIFDEEINTPLFIKLPGVNGRRIDAQVSSVDILPTLFEAIGIQQPKKIDGSSFLSLLKTKNSISEFRKYTFTERTPLMESLMFDSTTNEDEWLAPFIIADDENHYRDVSVRTKEWKLIFRESRNAQMQFAWWRRLSGEKSPIPEYELYHLSTDPFEKKNMIDKYPQMASELKDALAPFLAETLKQRKQILPN